MQLEKSAVRKRLQRLHHPMEIILVCVHWYAVYSLTLRRLEEMAERGWMSTTPSSSAVSVDLAGDGSHPGVFPVGRS